MSASAMQGGHNNSDYGKYTNRSVAITMALTIICYC